MAWAGRWRRRDGWHAAAAVYSPGWAVMTALCPNAVIIPERVAVWAGMAAEAEVERLVVAVVVMVDVFWGEGAVASAGETSAILAGRPGTAQKTAMSLHCPVWTSAQGARLLRRGTGAA